MDCMAHNITPSWMMRYLYHTKVHIWEKGENWSTKFVHSEVYGNMAYLTNLRKKMKHMNLEKTHSGRPLGGESQNDGFGVMSLQM